MPPIVLLTDFGIRDEYVAAVKGVLCGLVEHPLIIDAIHEVPRGDIEAGAWLLAQYARFYPAGTIHVAVVDPGVGTARAGLVLQAMDQLFVAPDNGLLSRVAGDGAKAWRIREGVRLPDSDSATFHGRDIFAYVAGRLARGDALDELAERVDEFVRLPLPDPEFADGECRGSIIYIDHYGNCITNIDSRSLPGEPSGRLIIRCGNLVLKGLNRTFADAAPGSAVALTGSHGKLEIAVNRGSAAEQAGLSRGDPVTVQREQ